jgi:aromatic-L-amino-acid decarboxylase
VLVLPTVQPGYLRELIPEEAPEQGETWKSRFQDIERVIMPGVSEYFFSTIPCRI